MSPKVLLMDVLLARSLASRVEQLVENPPAASGAASARPLHTVFRAAVPRRRQIPAFLSNTGGVCWEGNVVYIMHEEEFVPLKQI